MDINVTFWSEMVYFPILSSLVLVPLLTIVIIFYFFQTPAFGIRATFTAMLVNLILSLYMLIVFDTDKAGIQLAEHIEFLGLSYSVGVDGSNVLFIPLVAILSLLTMVYALITRYANDYKFMACLLGYEGLLMGAFTALNVMQFWLWCLLELLPVIFMTFRVGTSNQTRYLITKLLQFWGSSLGFTFLGFLLLGLSLEQGISFNWLDLVKNHEQFNDATLIFLLLFFGFAIRMPLFPFHAWLPLLAEQGAVASVGIYIVGIKLGIYAVVRFILPILPDVADQWVNFVLILSLCSIFYGALMALMQINIRRLLAFSVISHTGLLAIGVFCFNAYGLEGSILLSLAYGMATAGMFLSIGLIYERTRTAFLPRLGGLFDTNYTIAILFLISALSTMVMPGTPGFDAAHLLVEGTIEEHGWVIAIAILLGNVLAAAFLLWAFQRMFMATPRRFRQPYSTAHHPVRIERAITVIICGLLIGTGFYTSPWLKYIEKQSIALHASSYSSQPDSKHSVFEAIVDDKEAVDKPVEDHEEADKKETLND